MMKGMEKVAASRKLKSAVANPRGKKTINKNSDRVTRMSIEQQRHKSTRNINYYLNNLLL